MGITFSGLATGLDTASIIESLMEVERAPIDAIEDKVDYLEVKKETFTEFDSLLTTLSLSLTGLNSENDLRSYDLTNSGSDTFSVETTAVAEEGTYSVEVVSLASRQKDAANEGFSDADTTLLTGGLQIGDETISYENVTLEGLAAMVNDGEYGVSASVIDQGTDEDGYRIMFTVDTAGEVIDLVGTGDVTIDTVTDGHTVDGSKAEAIIDGISYYSTTNTFSNAINGLTYTLLAPSEDGADTVTVSENSESVIEESIQAIIDAYNEINTYISTVSESDSSMANAMKSVSRKIKDYLTDKVFIDIGISSDWETGELEFDSTVLAEAYSEDADAVVFSLFGDDDNVGFMTYLDEYVADQTNSSTGFLATKSDTIDSKIDRYDKAIESMETRLEAREATLEAQFSAMETLVATLNSTSDYLTSYFENND